jgi:hypothetical protein
MSALDSALHGRLHFPAPHHGQPRHAYTERGQVLDVRHVGDQEPVPLTALQAGQVQIHRLDDPSRALRARQHGSGHLTRPACG